MADIGGTDARDVLNGTAGADVIEGLGGDDRLTDTLGGDDTLRGGDGDDELNVTRTFSTYFGELTLEGGAGDDLLRVTTQQSYGSVTMDGGDGRDRFVVGVGGPATVRGGAGDDRILFAVGNGGGGGGQAVISLGEGRDELVLDGLGVGSTFVVSDFATGEGGDRIVFGELLATLLYGWDQSTNPFSTANAQSGFLAIRQSGSDAVISVTRNGAGSGFPAQTFITLQNVAVGQLTPYNLGGYAIDGSAPADAALTGTAAAEELAGGAGDDTVDGGDGADRIAGGAGDDLLRGGAGGDAMTGGLGSDTVEGGDGDDVLTERFGLSDTLRGGAGDDVLDYQTQEGFFNYASTRPFSARLEGGDGDDLILVRDPNGTASVTVAAGEGDDTVRFDARNGGFAANVGGIDLGGGNDRVFTPFNRGYYGNGSVLALTTGAGNDIISFTGATAYTFTFGAALAVTDFTAGDGGDVIEVSSFIGAALTSWDFQTNPFATGHLKLTVGAGGSVVLQIDGDGTGGSYTPGDFVRFDGLTATSGLTAFNFEGFAPDGTAPVALTVEGTAGADTLRGGVGGDTLRGLDGADTLRGRIGADRLEGGAGDDDLDGGEGGDALYGDDGNDVLSDTSRGANALRGGAGDDVLTIRTPDTGPYSGQPDLNQILEGDDGDDLLSFLVPSGVFGSNNSRGAATIRGGDGNDRIRIGAMTSGTIDAGAGDDAVTFSDAGTSTGAVITLGAGSDTIGFASFSSGGDKVVTDFRVGDGGDRIEVAAFAGGPNPFVTGALKLVQLGTSTQLESYGRVLLTLQNVTATELVQYNLGGFASNLPGAAGATVVGTGGDDSIQGTINADDLSGRAGDDQLSGGAGADRLFGEEGSDDLFGGAGDDLLDGGEGDDFLYGDAGLNHLRGGGGNDFLKPAGSGTVPNSDGTIDGGDGSDRISYFNELNGVTVDLRITTAQDTGRGLHAIANVENLSGTRFNDVLTGDAAANILWGSEAGDDRLVGNGGDDFLAVGAGNHTIDGGDGVDTLGVISFSGLTERLEISLASPGVRQDTGEGSIVLSSIENLSGSGFDDRLTGDARANVLAGAGGSDVLRGGAGDDLLLGDGATLMDSGDRGGSGPIRTAQSGEGEGADLLDGGDGDDVLRGGAGADIIEGGAGVDTAAYDGVLASATFEFGADGIVFVTEPGGRDTLTGVERLRFADGEIVVAGAAGADRVYAEWAGRNATGAELAFWTAELAAGRTDLAGVKAAVLADPLGQANTARVVGGLYAEYLGRAPGSAELEYWDAQVRGGVGFAGVRSVLVADPAGQAFAGERVVGLYLDYLGRAAAAGEVAFWSNEVRLGTGFDGIRSVLLADGAGQANTAARVGALYGELLGRAPAPAELSFWAGQIAGGTDFAGVRSALADDPSGRAYIARAIGDVYREYGGRAASADEVAFWSAEVRAGSNLADVREAVLAHPLGATYTAAALSGLYAELFGRDAASGEQAVWADLFRGGATLGAARSALTFDAGSAGRVEQAAGTAGADTFLFAPATRHLAVTGFDAAADRIDLRGSGFAGLDPLAAAREIVALDGRTDVLVTLDGTHDVLLRGVTLNQLGAEDFLI